MFIIVMGVSGCGKTTIGQLLARRMSCEFFDGDDFHSPENRVKMSRGEPLNDQDRRDWLRALAALIRAGQENGTNGVIACSALKEKYRKALQTNPSAVRFVYLYGSYELIYSRMENRTGHYMKPDMLQSQFDTLEEPQDALVEFISQAPEVIVEDIVRKLLPQKAYHADSRNTNSG